jgi:hypothetical protein
MNKVKSFESVALIIGCGPYLLVCNYQKYDHRLYHLEKKVRIRIIEGGFLMDS